MGGAHCLLGSSNGVTTTFILLLTGAVSLVAEAQAGTCSCRANGRDYEQGQTACIRGQLALCGMQLNNSSWKISAEPCPEASLRLKPVPQSKLPLLPRSSLPSC